MLNAGIGERHVNTLLAGMSVPGIHHKTLKRKEREAGEAIISVAKKSCVDAINEEISVAKKARQVILCHFVILSI